MNRPSVPPLVRHFDQWQRRTPGVRMLFAIMRKYLDDEASSRAALLAYYGFLSIFPVLLILSTVFGILLNQDPGLTNQFIRTAVSYFPGVGHDLQVNVHSLRVTGAALALGLLVALFGARGVADVVRTSLDHFWQIPHARRQRFPRSLFSSLGIIGVGAVGLVLAPVVFGYAFAFAPTHLVSILSALLTAVVLFWVLIVIIKLGCSARQPLRRIWLGALTAVVAMGGLQILGSYIMARELRQLNTLYGTFALVLGLLFWLYLQAQVLMFALEIDAVRAFKLWPRSLNPPLTPADQVAYQLYHERAQFHDDSVS